MYYKLKEKYQLRGWQKLPTGLVKKLSGEVIFLNPTVFYTLQILRKKFTSALI